MSHLDTPHASNRDPDMREHSPFTLDEARRLVEMPRVLATVEALEAEREHHAHTLEGLAESARKRLAAEADRERLAQSVSEAVREACLTAAPNIHSRDVIRALDLTRIVARVLGGKS